MRLDKRLIAVFTMIMLVTASTVAAHLATAMGPPVAVVSDRASVGLDDRLTIQFTGDIMLGDAARPRLGVNGYDLPFRHVGKFLTGDYQIGNAEAPFSLGREPFNPAKEYSYASSPLGVPALFRAGFDALGLANNHAMDTGPAGLRDTMGHLSKFGVKSFGAGQRLRRAEQPLLIESSIGTVGVVALGENYGGEVTADTMQAGTVDLGIDTVQRGHDLARAAGADWVIGYVHWGDNYSPINRGQKYWARVMVNAGYDMIVGHGPHISQPVQVIRGVPVFYSIGNFTFGSPGQFHPVKAPGVGLIVGVTLSRDNRTGISVRCIRTDNDLVRFVPKPCGKKRATVVLKGLNPRILIMPNGVGLLPCDCLRRKG